MLTEEAIDRSKKTLFEETAFYKLTADELYPQSLSLYRKKPASVSELLDHIEEIGFRIDDREAASEYLSYVDYFRFKAYFIPFRRKGQPVSNVSFEKVRRIYEFDRRLRSIILSICEIIEIKLRANLIKYHVGKYGATGYLNAENFNNSHDHEKFVHNLKDIFSKNNKKLPIKHYSELHDGFVPLWVAMEYFSFGQLSYFYSDLNSMDRKELSLVISEGYSSKWYDIISSWLKCVVDLRNECAHFARLYYKWQIDTPKTPKELYSVLNRPLNKSIFDYLLVIKYLFPNKVKWNNEFMPQLTHLIDEYNDSIKLSHIGFPPEWKALLLWNE